MNGKFRDKTGSTAFFAREATATFGSANSINAFQVFKWERNRDQQWHRWTIRLNLIESTLQDGMTKDQVFRPRGQETCDLNRGR